MKNIIQKMSEQGLIDPRELQRVAAGSRSEEPLHRVAVRLGMIAEETYLQFVSQELNMPVLSAIPEECRHEELDRISPFFLQEHCFLPLKARDGDELWVVCNDPFDYLIYDNLKQLFPHFKQKIFLAKVEDITAWINELLNRDGSKQPGSDADQEAEDELSTLQAQDDIEQLRDLASEAPIIRKVNHYLTKAVELGASDIHIEPYYDRVLVRFRIDGILNEFETYTASQQQAVISRIKIMSKLDISERRLPQDGRIKMKIAGRNIDLRISCLPTMYGESVVMRILDRAQVSFSLDHLGFPPRELSIFEELIQLPYGILLVTGPTGSGKTTTLYSALNAIKSSEKKIITVEDPVEYELDGINQVQVNTKSGLTFARGLRSIVRQDPDVILIGEIRDTETADIAIHSALTGHLVFSTLHTNDSAGAITRLIEMGVEDYLISSSLAGVMAQRLVRVLCKECKEAFVPDTELLEKLDLPFQPTESAPVYKPRGCPACNQTGYRGRTAIFELLTVNNDIRELILANKSSTRIQKKAREQGMKLLQTDGWSKVEQGRTSIAEVLKTTISG